MLKKLNAWLISGTEKECGANICILYIGEESTKKYITELIFRRIHKEIFYQNKTKTELFTLYFINKENIDILFIEAIGDLFKKSHHKKYFSTPIWIKSKTDLPLDESTKSIKSDIRKIHKYRLGYRITTDIEEIINFYHEMLIPYMQSRHNEKAITLDFKTIQNKIDKKECSLLLIEMGNESISGVLIIQEDNKTPILWRNGLKNGNTAYWNTGAIFATYYFSSKYLHKLGHKDLNLGNTRSFLNDGVLNFKKKWPLTIKSSNKSHLLIIPFKITESTISFLIKNPFIIHINKNKLACAIFHAQIMEKNFSSLGDISENRYFLIKNSKITLKQIQVHDR
ncbi:MAG: hypothetical protein K4305_03575 [Chlorobium sp.]|uniref:hypothetical protein n=1 Tax=Chlorobium sp. TaxID=1095 RepID=UPI002F427CE6